MLVILNAVTGMQRKNSSDSFLGLLCPVCSTPACGQFGGLPVLVHEVSQRVSDLRLRRTHAALAFTHDAILPSPCVH